MVNNEGKPISDSYLGLKGKKAAQELTQQYKLIPAQRKNLSLQNGEALRQSETARLRIYKAISDSLPNVKTMDELERRLKTQGIATLYKYKGGTEEKQGVSFRLDNDIFKGSKVDRQFSLGNLQRTMGQSQKETLIQNKSLEDKVFTQHIEEGKPRHTFSYDPSPIHENDKGKERESFLHILTRPETAGQSISNDWSPKKKKKRKHRL